MADIIQQRRDTAARWAEINPILLEGEVGYVTDNPNQYKIGNGRDRWNDLPFRGYTGTITQNTGDDENAVMSQKATTEKLTELGLEVRNIGSDVDRNTESLKYCFVIKNQILKAKDRIKGSYYITDDSVNLQDSDSSYRYNPIRVKSKERYYIGNYTPMTSCFVAEDGTIEKLGDTYGYNSTFKTFESDGYLYLSTQSSVDMTLVLTQDNVIPNEYVEGVFYSLLSDNVYIGSYTAGDIHKKISQLYPYIDYSGRLNIGEVNKSLLEEIGDEIAVVKERDSIIVDSSRVNLGDTICLRVTPIKKSSGEIRILSNTDSIISQYGFDKEDVYDIHYQVAEDFGSIVVKYNDCFVHYLLIKQKDMTEQINNNTISIKILEKEVSDLYSYKKDEEVILDYTSEMYIKKDGSFAISSGGYKIAELNGSNYIEIEPDKEYIISANSHYGNLLYAFYDENKVFIEGLASESGSAFTSVNNELIKSPINARYIAISYISSIAWGGKLFTTTRITFDKKWKNKKWGLLGDSLTASYGVTSTHYYEYIQETTGIDFVNLAVSGSGYAARNGTNEAFYQRASLIPTDVDLVTIFGSFNDMSGYELGSLTDTIDKNTLCGYINKAIDVVQSIVPTTPLGIITPTPWDTTPPTVEENTKYERYVNAIVGICKLRSIPCLDLYHCSNLRPWDEDFRLLAYSKDNGSGTHPDETGHKIIAPRFKAFLETLIM